MTEGKRDVLAFRVGERENQSAWEDLLDDLKERGVAAVDLWITDGNKAMTNAIDKKFLGLQAPALYQAQDGECAGLYS